MTIHAQARRESSIIHYYLHEQSHVHSRDHRSQGDQQDRGGAAVGVSSHHFPAGGEVDLREDGDRQLHAEEHLREYQPLERVAYQEDEQQGGEERQQDAHAGVKVARVVGLVVEAGEDGRSGDARRDGGGDARQQQRRREDDPGVAAHQRYQEPLGLVQLLYRHALLEEGGGGEDNHRRVDGPADDHREERVVKLILQLLAYHRLVLKVPLPALDDLRVQEQVVRHHHRPQHAHDNQHGVLREGGLHPARDGLPPIHVHEEQLIQERQADDGDEGDNPPLYFIICIAEQQGEAHDGDDGRAHLDGHAEQHPERDGATQNLRQRGGYAGEQRRREDRAAQPAGQVPIGRLREAQPRHDAEVRHVVLDDNQHDGGKSDHPQQRVAERGAGGEVGRPVARVDEAYGDEQPRPDILQQVQRPALGPVVDFQFVQ